MLLRRTLPLTQLLLLQLLLRPFQLIMSAWLRTGRHTHIWLAFALLYLVPVLLCCCSGTALRMRAASQGEQRLTSNVL